MFERLDAIKKRYEELIEMQSKEEIYSDLNKLTEVQKELKSLSKPYEVYNKYLEVVQNLEDANELLNDEDMKEMASLEIEELTPLKGELISELEILLLPTDENDDKNVVVEIRGAAGGDEANIFAGDLFKMYSKYSEERGFKIEVLDSQAGANGGFTLIEFMIKGDGAYSTFKYESGAHRVQRVPQTETQGRIHTSTATVLVMPEIDDVQVDINESDIKVDVCRSSGAGGQSVNTTDSAVRMTHVPTNIVVYSQTERSQIKNREKALKLLKIRVYEYFKEQEESKLGSERKSKIGSGDRSEKIRTYNYPQNRLTDHRINYTNMNLDRIVEGRMQDLIDALVNEDLKRKLEGNND